MSKLTYKVSYYALYAMFALILVVLGLFYFGGNAVGEAVIPGVDPEMWQPAQTDTLLFLVYGLLGLAVAATLVAAVFQFGSALRDNPKKALESLLGLLLLAVLLIATWSMGDDTPLNIPGYDGTDNVPFWLNLTDMFLYTIYILLAVTGISIFISGVKKKLS